MLLYGVNYSLEDILHEFQFIVLADMLWKIQSVNNIWNCNIIFQNMWALTTCIDSTSEQVTKGMKGIQGVIYNVCHYVVLHKVFG